MSNAVSRSRTAQKEGKLMEKQQKSKDSKRSKQTNKQMTKQSCEQAKIRSDVEGAIQEHQIAAKDLYRIKTTYNHYW